MCGWLSLPASEASARKALCIMRSVCGSACRSNRNTLIATSRSPKGSRARYTRLVAPRPISRMIAYLPIRACGSKRALGDAARARRRRLTARGPDVAGDVLQQLGLRVRLAEEHVHAEFRGLAAVLVRGARRDHDDRHVARARIAAQVARQVEAVHARHLDVDQHHVGQRVLHLRERIQPVLGRQHLVALALEQAAGDLAHGERVVHHHDQRRGGAAGPRPPPRAVVRSAAARARAAPAATGLTISTMPPSASTVAPATPGTRASCGPMLLTTISWWPISSSTCSAMRCRPLRSSSTEL